MQRLAMLTTVLLGLAVPLHAFADFVQVRITGTVEENRFVSGVLLGVPSDAPVAITFSVNSADFLDSAALPGRTRGYAIDQSSWSMTVGGVPTPLVSPYPAGQTPRFCIRNNDPRVDGFFLSVGTDLDTPLLLNLGLANNTFGVAFLRTFSAIPPAPSAAPDNTLFSLDIRDAQCERAFQNISSYNFTIEQSDFNQPAIFLYNTISIRNLEPGCPALQSQPGNVSICPGGNPTFIAGVSTAPPGMAFTWYRGNNPISPTSSRHTFTVSPDGLTGTLTILGATAADATSNGQVLQGLDGYRCLITSTCGTISTELGSLRLCRADFNCSGGVSVQDVFDFLDAWFAGSAAADINGAGGVSVQDVFDFLVSWFAAC